MCVCALTGNLLCRSCRQGVCVCVCPDRRLALRAGFVCVCVCVCVCIVIPCRIQKQLMRFEKNGKDIVIIRKDVLVLGKKERMIMNELCK